MRSRLDAFVAIDVGRNDGAIAVTYLAVSSLWLLGALRRERRSLVDDVMDRLPGVGSDVSALVERLGLED